MLREKDLPMTSENYIVGNVTLDILYNNLPQGVKDKIKLYEMNGLVIFPLRNPETNEMTNESIYYLISYPDQDKDAIHGEKEAAHIIYRYGVKVNYDHFEHQFYASLVKFMKHLGEGTAKTTDTEGGDLGRGDND